jgi:hypothetical protein|tara:strand:- start:81 stop:257 length:177 start_codon:yes stop_codon:yes gene_type:complete
MFDCIDQTSFADNLWVCFSLKQREFAEQRRFAVGPSRQHVIFLVFSGSQPTTVIWPII